MKLPNPFASIGTKQPKTEYLLAILLRDEKITAIITEEIEGKIKIVGKNEELLPINLEQTPVETWIQVLDRVITRAEETIPPNAETNKTVFGLKENWVEEKKIKKDYLAKLKSVCDALSLSPIGFLVISEAIAHLIQEEEGAPLNAVLTEIGTKELTVTLFRSGKILEVQHGEIGKSVPETVELLLKQFSSVEVLPTRIIVLGGEQGENLAQEFIAYQWSKSLPFLHMPQVSLLPIGFDAKSVVYGAATQMGLEIVGSIIDKTQDIKTITEQPVAQTGLGENTLPQPVTATGITETATAIGAVPQELTTAKTENFGFVENEDIALTPHKSEDQTTPSPVAAQPPPIPQQPPMQEQPLPAYESQIVKESPLDKIRGIFGSLANRLPAFPFSGSGVGILGNKLLLIPVGVIILLLLLIGAYFYFMKATVVLEAQAKEVSENKEITFSLQSDNNFAADTIAAKSVSVTLPGTVSTDTTGKKDTGDKAHGNVTIYNSADTKKQLAAGSTITSSNGLNFTLDKDVTIASSSGDIFSGIKSGTATVAVTAEKIGTDYNLPSNTKFAVANNSSLAGKNDSAFSGGSKKTIQVVAKKDRDKLLTDLPKSLQSKAIDEINKKISSDEVTLPITIDPTVGEKEFDKKENDEAKKVSLTAQVTFSAAVYKKADLTAYAKERLKDQATDDQTISDKGIANDLKDIKKTDDSSITAQLAVKANLLPKIDSNAIAKQIAGKSFSAAGEIVKKEPQIAGITISVVPSIPFFPKLLPMRASQITVTLNSQ